MEAASIKIADFLTQVKSKLRPDQILTGPDSLIKYKHDFWPLAAMLEFMGKQTPLPPVALLPESAVEISQIVKIAGSLGINLIPYGAGSNVTGATSPRGDCCMLDLGRMNRIENLSDDDLIVTVEAGIQLKDLEQYLNSKGFTLKHFPQSYNLASIGGLIATNSVGQYSTKYGGIEAIVVNLEVVLPDGTITWLKNVLTPRSSMGPDLNHLFEGSEGTLGVITRAMLRILPICKNSWMRAFTFNSFSNGLHLLRSLMREEIIPAVARLYDETESQLRFGQESPTLILLFEHPSSSVLDSVVHEAKTQLDKASAKEVGEEPVKKWLNQRFEFKQEMKLVQDMGAWFDTIEVATTWSNLDSMYAAFKKDIGEMEGVVTVLAHASHAYTIGACIYFTVVFEQNEDKYWKIWDTAARLALEHHTTLSHHHGVGLLKKKYIKAELGGAFEIVSKLKHSLDEKNVMNAEL